ncbi:hypothetical protein BJ322DRAFT_1103400 [Thelephora terrestris]|uniref:Uncharacterized protein n=1 Tax=Thelephora terrestris TaxID=56493 RepID=A0A9P6HWD9_9AGAM|nr:hypothetical protein BJ322DRAFT_1103400 [Thelephora terrestris]
MYSKWIVFVLTLLSCMFLMAAAAPVADGDAGPAKRLQELQARRDGIVARRATPVNNAKRTKPSRKP